MSDTERKEKPASQQKLHKQRKEGSIASSADVAAFSAMAVAMLFLIVRAPVIWRDLSSAFDDMADIIQMPATEALDVAMGNIGHIIFISVVPVVSITILTSVIVALVANGGVLTSLKPVTPDFGRLSIAKGVKRVYGKRGWAEFLLSLTRLLIWVAFVAFVISLSFPAIIRSMLCGLECQTEAIAPVFKFLLSVAVVFLIFLAAVALRVQNALFLNEQKMTQSEVKKEKKDQHGSDEVRKERNRLTRKAAEQPSKITLDQSDFLFTFEGQGVAVSFAPPERRLPVILGKAKRAEQLRDMKKQVAGHSVWIAENELLVMEGVKAEIGDYLPEAALQELSREYWNYKRQTGDTTRPY